MIKDKLANYADYCAKGSLLEKGFAFLADTYRPGMKDGRVEIDGDRCFALIQTYTTFKSADKRFESHKLYADIQYIGSGSETIEYHPVEELKVAEDRTPASDLVFFEDARGTDIVLKAGEFAVFLPQDGHKPCIIHDAPTEVRKVVIKVRCK